MKLIAREWFYTIGVGGLSFNKYDMGPCNVTPMSMQSWQWIVDTEPRLSVQVENLLNDGMHHSFLV